MVAFFYLSLEQSNMLFNSFDFGFFLLIVYTIYWIIGTKRKKSQNFLLLVASYVFYGLWDWRFLLLLIASSLIDYLAGQAIGRAQSNMQRKFLLWISIFWNLGILITFKYYNFFITSFSDLFSIEIAPSGYTIWSVIIPLGLSFYTFQTMSYTIDVYRGKIKPTKNILNFLCFVGFFPQLIAGPIERAKKLLPQFKINRSFDLQTSIEGLRQILWGLFKKILVADKLGLAVTMVFNNPESYGSMMLIFAAVLFCFQIYCDFSGYTDIAIGTAKLFGFRLSRNFNLPYLATSITDFWQRWHITLTQWFTDYVYIPLVKNSSKPTRIIRASALVFTLTLVGLWHGANWTFIAFGLFNGLVLALERVPFFHKKETLIKKLKNIPRIFSVGYVFVIFTISAIFFRADSISHAWDYFSGILTNSGDILISSLIGFKLVYLVVMLITEMNTKGWEFPLQKMELLLPKPARWAIYYLLIILIIRYAEPKEAFIYFQF